jgi:CRP/FNR family transcriptional regulator, nitrogen oxide reductase regulator
MGQEQERAVFSRLFTQCTPSNCSMNWLKRGEIMGATSVYAGRPAQPGQSTSASVIMERVNLLSESQLCINLPQKEVERVAAYARPKTFARNELLFRQGQPVQQLFLVRTGSVKITQLSAAGSEVILWMYGTANVLGVLAEPRSSYHTSTARAMEACTALTWDCTTMQSLTADYPQIRQNMSHILVNRLNELEERFREVATERVARRLALALIRLSKHVGKKAHDGIEVFLSREELAQMTGTTLFTISRILSQWGREDFISPRRSSVLLRDPKRLELAGCEI